MGEVLGKGREVVRRSTALGHGVEAGSIGVRLRALSHVALHTLLGLSSALASERDPSGPESNSGDGEDDSGEDSSTNEAGTDLQKVQKGG